MHRLQNICPAKRSCFAPAGIDEEMFACAETIAEIDRQMQDMYRRIADAEANGDAVKK